MYNVFHGARSIWTDYKHPFPAGEGVVASVCGSLLQVEGVTVSPVRMYTCSFPSGVLPYPDGAMCPPRSTCAGREGLPRDDKGGATAQRCHLWLL